MNWLEELHFSCGVLRCWLSGCVPGCAILGHGMFLRMNFHLIEKKSCLAAGACSSLNALVHPDGDVSEPLVGSKLVKLAVNDTQAVRRLSACVKRVLIRLILTAHAVPSSNRATFTLALKTR